MDKLRKQGMDIQPVEIEGRTIARSFWGKGWCDHLESFGDYSNRLPRGRTYVRNGSVCHLGIAQGQRRSDRLRIGTLQHQYRHRAPCQARNGSTLKKQCTGKIGSLIELLQGRLSDEIMDVVTDREKGLFPLPGEITYQCNCPDWAGMCKHIAAVMYGIGARLDERPELLFLLRGVDHEELIDTDAATAEITRGTSRRTRRRSLAGDALEDVFGVELEDTSKTPPFRRPKASNKAGKKTAKKTAAAKKAAAPKKRSAKRVTKKAARKTRPFKPTPRSIARLRKKLDMTHAEFARANGVTTQSVKNWEDATGPLALRAKNLAALARLHERRVK